MIRVGLNGFGRIGRAVCRINLKDPAFELVAINDLDPNVENLAYLLKYDSTYGRLDEMIRAEAGGILIGKNVVPVHSCRDSAGVPWEKYDLDVLIEATGVQPNVVASAGLVRDGRVPKVVVTWSPPSGIDKTIIFGANERTYDPHTHHVLSASICDAISAAPVLKIIDDRFGLETGFITTLHPWLSYQNLVDGPVSSVASPGHFWQDFSLGRSSVSSLIPKSTTLISALSCVIPDVAARLDAISYRVPTGIVASSDMTLVVRNKTSRADVNRALREEAESQRVIGYQEDHLVSLDFAGIRESMFVDGRWTRVQNDTLVKLVLWYDNEWGYSSRVVDVARLAAGVPGLSTPPDAA